MVEISKKAFNELVLNPNKITLDQSIALKNIIKKYPFFQVARVIELFGLKKFNNIRYKNALKKTSIYSTSRVNLFEIIESIRFSEFILFLLLNISFFLFFSK